LRIIFNCNELIQSIHTKVLTSPIYPNHIAYKLRIQLRLRSWDLCHDLLSYEVLKVGFLKFLDNLQLEEPEGEYLRDQCCLRLSFQYLSYSVLVQSFKKILVFQKKKIIDYFP